MLNDVLADYIPILTAEERRNFALLYASFQNCRQPSEIDPLFHKFLPLCLSHPTILNELLLTNLSKQLFGMSLEEKTSENEGFRALRSELVYRAMCISLGATLNPSAFLPGDASNLYLEIVSVIPPVAFLTKFCHLLFELEAADILYESGLVAGREAEQILLIILKHLLGRVSDNDLRTGITASHLIDICYDAALRPLIFSEPKLTFDDSKSPQSLLEHVFDHLRQGDEHTHHYPALIRDADFPERISVVVLKGTTWLPDENGKQAEYVVCGRIHPLSAENPQQLGYTNVGLPIFFDSLQTAYTPTKEIVKRISALLVFSEPLPGGERTLEIRGGESLLSLTLTSLTLVSPILDEGMLDGGTATWAVSDEMKAAIVPEYPTSAEFVLQREANGGAAATPSVTASTPSPTETIIQNNIGTEATKTPDVQPAIRPSETCTQPPERGIISSAFWWGADPNKSYTNNR